MSNQGDCVSIKSNCFGGDFEKKINNLSFVGALVYGHVTEVIDGNQDFTTKWDIDGQISKHMSLQKFVFLQVCSQNHRSDTKNTYSRFD